MHKLYYLIVLHFVISSALGDAVESGFTYNSSDAKRESITPVADKNVAFDEEKTLKRLDVIADSIKMVPQNVVTILDTLFTKENEKLDTLIASQRTVETFTKFLVNSLNAYPLNCMEVGKYTNSSGIYNIKIEEYVSDSFKVYCEEELFDGKWTVVARRMDGSIDFNRNWTDYKVGFGNLDGEFFIGMEKLYMLTNRQQRQELIFVLRDFENNQKYAKYSEFAIGNESKEYKIKTLGEYSGDAGDSFTYHRDQTFKTKDRDTSTEHCTQSGAWWYNDCHRSNLFGSYLKGAYESDDPKGVEWVDWHGYLYSLKFVQMMIRPKNT